MLNELEQAHRWGKLPTPPYSAIGLDIGTHKIGLASGQSMLGSADPIGHIKANDGTPHWPQLEEALEKLQPQLVVVGWPLNMDDSPTFLTATCERVANKIHGRYGLTVRCVDERLSTREAWELSLGSSSSRKNKPVDDLAAVVILETWFNSQV